MKTNLIYAATILLVLFNVSITSAQIDNLTNLSPEWIRSGARNASIDGTDIMVYNPGGVSRLKSGLHLSIGNTSFFRKPSHEYDYGMGQVKYEQDGNDLAVPNIYASYNKNNLAVFGGMYIAGGGATANFPKGSISTDLITFSTLSYLYNAYGMPYTNGKDAYLKASSYYITTALGGAYSVNDKFSFGLFVRHLTAKNKAEAGVTITDAYEQLPDMPFALETNSNANGLGFVAGFDIKASENLNFAVRYESKVNLDFETELIKDDFGFTTDGEKSRRDFPAVLGTGISYSINEKFKTLVDFNYYFQKQANWGKTFVVDSEVENSELAGDASTYSISFEYRFTPKFLISLGGTYSLFNFENIEGYYANLGAFETVPGNNFAISTGFAYNATEKIRINAGFTKGIYEKDKKIAAMNFYPLATDVTVNNSISSFAIGVDFLF